MKKIMINEFGDESKMILNEVDTPSPKDNEVLVQHKAIGINFIDIYQRTGLYPLNLPSSLGLEASGVVCLLYTSPSPRDRQKSRMPSSA